MASDSDSNGTVRERVKEILAPFQPVYDAWMVIVGAFSWFMARLVAAILFVIGFIPYGLVLRLVGTDPLSRRLDDEADSYWTDPEADNRTLDDFKKQY